VGIIKEYCRREGAMMTRRSLFLLLLFSLIGIAAWADPTDEDYTRLARISYLEGRVSYQHIADVEWSAASINLPLEPGDRIYTGPEGRAEIEFDDGSIYRLAKNTDVEILSLKEDLIQVRVMVGLSTLMVSNETDFEVDTPAAAFNTLRQGVYRFDINDDGVTIAIVRKGKLEAANNHFSRRIESGEMLNVESDDTGNPDFARYERRDEWDEWNDRRNADLNAYADSTHVPDNVYIGSSDLQRYGRWVQIDTYGNAWVPDYVDVAWTPYSVGRWCYRPMYGWTWISYEPWGWLPYHYGRWYYSSVYGWCWIPGPSYSFGFWSPGLVAFYSGPGWISWCPLGPGDYYEINNYHYNHRTFVQVVDQMRRLHSRAPGDLLNRDHRGAFHTISTDRFRNGELGNRGRNEEWVNVDRPWSHGNLVRDRLNVQPTTTSFRAVPGSQPVQPARTERMRPAVVRTNPGENLRGQGQFTRITNPQIPSLTPRAARPQNEQRGADSGNHAKPDARVTEAPQNGRSIPSAQNPAGNASGEQGGRRTTVFGLPATPRNNQVNSGAGANSPGATPNPSATPENNAPAVQRNGRVWRYDGRPPQQDQTQQAPPEDSPRSEDRVITNRNEPHSSGEVRPNNDAPAAKSTPHANPNAIFNAPRVTAPSSEKKHVTRSETAPSSRRGDGGDRSSSSTSSSTGKSSDGGNSKQDNSGSQKSSERGASNDGGGRK
jgi:hypothetical protein